MSVNVVERQKESLRCHMTIESLSGCAMYNQQGRKLFWSSLIHVKMKGEQKNVKKPEHVQ